MITLKFKKFRSGKYNDKGEIEDLYILKDGEKVLYIGICKRGAWNRWFDGWSSHMGCNIFGQWYANTSAGRAILENSPRSLNWTIELWTIEDCLRFLGHDITDGIKSYIGLCAMRYIESEMIAKLHPAMNAKF